MRGPLIENYSALQSMSMKRLFVCLFNSRGYTTWIAKWGVQCTQAKVMYTIGVTGRVDAGSFLNSHRPKPGRKLNVLN